MTPTNRKKLVVAHSVRADAPLHEVETNRALARWLAQIMGLKYGGSYDPQLHDGRDLYLLPTQTLVGAEAARQLGVKGPEDLWGGMSTMISSAPKPSVMGCSTTMPMRRQAGLPCFPSGYAALYSTVSACSA